MTISIPKLKSVGDVYNLCWENEHIIARVDHISEDRDTITGEFKFSLNGDTKGHLYMGKLNMLSPGAKKTWVGELNKRLELEWDLLLEQACVMVVDSYRKGEPATKVGDMPDRIKPRYRLYPWILEENMTTLYGFGGKGKSKVATLWSLIVQTGEDILGGMKPIKGNVLVLDWESCAEDWDEYVKAIRAGMCFESKELPLYRRCHRTLANEILEVQSIVLDNDIKLVIIDSVGMASELTDQFHSSAIGFLRAARSLPCSILLIDHETKEGKQFGSVYKQNEVRSAFELKSNQEVGSKEIDMAIYHTKVNSGMLTKPQGFHVTYDGTEEVTTMVVFEKRNISDMPEQSSNLPLQDRIKNILARGSMKVVNITEELGLSKTDEDSVRTVLNRYKDKLFNKLTDGSWGLLRHDEI